MKPKLLPFILFLPLLAVVGCALGPIGPPLGLGPGMDQLVFFGLLAGIGVVVWPRMRKWIWASNRSDQPFPMSRSENRAIAIATERYAKGEITREEYLKLIEDLRQHAV